MRGKSASAAASKTGPGGRSAANKRLPTNTGEKKPFTKSIAAKKAGKSLAVSSAPPLPAPAPAPPAETEHDAPVDDDSAAAAPPVVPAQKKKARTASHKKGAKTFPTISAMRDIVASICATGDSVANEKRERARERETTALGKQQRRDARDAAKKAKLASVKDRLSKGGK
ncbi:hypothetical protein BC828DRAFT_404117 [Blastocladiella britannica]|nr:hypothetical protein BC828DRAFT_404117 [Blastocladiella britannica]